MNEAPQDRRAAPRLVVVIPALNAARRLPECLASLTEARGLLRAVIVCDGGSQDATIDIARAAGSAVLVSARGRGGQIAAGVEAARRVAAPGDWVLILHADTVPEPGWSATAREAILRAPASMKAFHFRFALDDDAPHARRFERRVNRRARLLKLPYGDQGLMLPMAFLDALSGFKPWPLFEDVDIVRRIGGRRLEELPVRAITSAERFQQEGYLARSSKNLFLLARYFLGAPPERLARSYGRKR